MLNCSQNLSIALQKSTRRVQHNLQSFTETLLRALAFFLLGTACLHLWRAVSSAVTFCSQARTKALFPPIANPVSWLAPTGRGKILLILS